MRSETEYLGITRFSWCQNFHAGQSLLRVFTRDAQSQLCSPSLTSFGTSTMPVKGGDAFSNWFATSSETIQVVIIPRTLSRLMDKNGLTLAIRGGLFPQMTSPARPHCLHRPRTNRNPGSFSSGSKHSLANAT